MYVKDRMNRNVISVFPEASISLAFQLMTEQGYSHLPVIQNEKLVGMVTEKLLTEVSPSKATTLSIYELNYLLSKTKVKDIMNKDVIFVKPDMLIEEAAALLRDKMVDALPVIDDHDKLLGILTRTDIIDAFIELMGINDPGTRIVLEVKDEAGALADILGIIKEYGMSITHISSFDQNTADQKQEIVMRLNTLETDEVLNVLKEKNYNIISIHKKQ
ncbi:MAG: CBS domain-containing protein [Epulopiscium sp.]|nr:CBS domain-containing protein [Candidatus Epulonipiscium sp.]